MPMGERILPSLGFCGQSDCIRSVVERCCLDVPWLTIGAIAIGCITSSILCDKDDIIAIGIVNPLPFFLHQIEGDFLLKFELDRVV